MINIFKCRRCKEVKTHGREVGGEYLCLDCIYKKEVVGDGKGR